jgi:carbonic anhydrase
MALLPGDVTGTRYEGSLTTPPCSERVHWTVLDAAIEMDQRQIATFTRHYQGNNRPHQPVNGRLVAHDSSRGD